MKGIWDWIVHHPKELGLSPQGEENLPWRDPQLTEIVRKLMSQGVDELGQDEHDALFRGIVGEEPRSLLHRG